jgi:ribosomal-protein-alanine N-acetyltransferase
MSLLITPAGAEAAEIFAALHAEGLPPGWAADEFRQILTANGAFGLLVASEHPCGMLAAWVAADEAEILALAVTPSARRRGYARDLVSAAIAEAGRRGARAVFLEVAADNRPAIMLYRALGFAQAGRRRGYYLRAPRPAVDALVLRLDIVAVDRRLDLSGRGP